MRSGLDSRYLGVFIWPHQPSEQGDLPLNFSLKFIYLAISNN